jgi:hypothetical protein
MGKRCDCGFILEAFTSDPKIYTLPLAARALWLVLTRRMQEMGLSVLMFGSEIPNPAGIALMVSVSETELETQMAPLLARGLLVRREDGALESPLLAGRVKRAETARINGLKGGRPRKDGTPAGQRHMLLPNAGGLSAGSAETQAKPGAGDVGSVAKLSSLPEEKAQEAKPGAVTHELVQRVGHAAAEAAGLDPARQAFHFGPVRQWLEAGADAALVLRVVGEVMARPNRPVPKGLGYFSAAVLAAIQARPAAEVALAGVAWVESAEDYNARVDAWEATGSRGAPPIRRRAVAA